VHRELIDESREEPVAKERQTPPRLDPRVEAVLALQRTVGNAATVSLMRKKKRGYATIPSPAETAKATLKAAIGGKTVGQCKDKLVKALTKGPLFTGAQIFDIETLEADKDGLKWLREVGIGTTQEAQDYLDDETYKDWLKLAPGKRLLIASLAWSSRARWANDENPPPSFTLARALEIERLKKATGAQQQLGQLEQERDETIRDAFVNTMMDPTTAEQANIPQGDRTTVMAQHARAQYVLTRVLLILQEGLEVFDKGPGQHVDFKSGDVVRALAHGGRVNIRIPALTGTHTAMDLTDWLGITEGGHKAEAIKARGFGTHHMSIGENKVDKHGNVKKGHFKESGGTGASIVNTPDMDIRLYGLDLAAGGLGKLDFNGDVILPDGGHGHMFIGLTKPTAKKDGALQIGIESTAPHAASPVGYEHTVTSTEATANPESSYYGHKMQKVGGGKLHQNQRLVDLNKLNQNGQDWLKALEGFEGVWINYLASQQGNERQAYELIAGQRT
jgi:hypothetical protein